MTKITVTNKNIKSNFTLFFHPFIPSFDGARVKAQLNKSRINRTNKSTVYVHRSYKDSYESSRLTSCGSHIDRCKSSWQTILLCTSVVCNWIQREMSILQYTPNSITADYLTKPSTLHQGAYPPPENLPVSVI